MSVLTSVTLVPGDPPKSIKVAVLNQNGHPIPNPGPIEFLGGGNHKFVPNPDGVSGTIEGVTPGSDSLIVGIGQSSASLPVVVEAAIPTTFVFSD